MVVAGVLLFGVLTFLVSLLFGRMKEYDRGKIAVSVILTAWGSLVYGLYLSKGMP